MIIMVIATIAYTLDAFQNHLIWFNHHNIYTSWFYFLDVIFTNLYLSFSSKGVESPSIEVRYVDVL